MFFLTVVGGLSENTIIILLCPTDGRTRCNRHVARQARSLLAVSGNIDGLMETLLTKLVPRLVAFALKIILKENQEVNNIR